jgi:hypothetical protein
MAVTITRTPWIDDDGTGTTGTVINNAVKTALYNDIDGALAKVQPVIPAWVVVPFNAANFTGTGGMTWTVTAGNVFRFAYQVTNKTCLVSVYLNGTAIGGTPAIELRITLPAGLVPVSTAGTTAAAGTPAVVVANLSTTYLSIFKIDSSAWASGALGMQFTFPFEIA